MSDHPPIVSEFGDDGWHDVEATKDETRARKVLATRDDRGKREVIEPRPSTRR
jgi:hypothetical protein